MQSTRPRDVQVLILLIAMLLVLLVVTVVLGDPAR